MNEERNWELWKQEKAEIDAIVASCKAHIQKYGKDKTVMSLSHSQSGGYSFLFADMDGGTRVSGNKIGGCVSFHEAVVDVAEVIEAVLIQRITIEQWRDYLAQRGKTK